MSRRFNVIGVGSPLLDVLAHVSEDFLRSIPGEKGGMELLDAGASADLISQLGSDAIEAAGGSAANTIFGLAEMGFPCTFLGKLGQDLAGDAYLAQSIKAGVDISRYKRTRELPTGKVCCLVTPDSERTFRTYLGAASSLTAEDISVADFEDASHAHLEGYMLFDRQLALKILTSAKSAGCTVSLDLASFEVVRANEDILESLLENYVDIVFANEEEAKAFTGQADPQKNLDSFAKLCKTVAVKIGPQGAWLRHDKQTVRINALKVNALDSTGAGDLWAAGFLYHFLQGGSLEESGKLASLLGAEVVQILGADLPKSTWKRIKEQL